VTHRGPCPPRTFCDSVKAVGSLGWAAPAPAPAGLGVNCLRTGERIRVALYLRGFLLQSARHSISRPSSLRRAVPAGQASSSHRRARPRCGTWPGRGSPRTPRRHCRRPGTAEAPPAREQSQARPWLRPAASCTGWEREKLDSEAANAVPQNGCAFSLYLYAE